MTFPNAKGESLSARLDEAEGDPRAYALFAHCFTCTKDIFAASRIAKVLQEHGISVLRFDFTGLGESEGDFANTNFTSNTDDLVSAADYMRDNLQAPALIIGHSLGGSAILAAAARIPAAKAVVTLGSPADVAHVAHHFDSSREEIIDTGEAEVCLVGRPFKIRKQFIEDIEGACIQSSVESLGKALMVMHAPLDATVGIENAQKIFGWAKHPKSYVSLDDADHLLSKKADAEYAGQLISSWSERYI
ncbi:alpha/beta fold hydrolase [Ruegeria sp. SCPT10]|uniref:alpha/beta hydrolase family protein n=1 Tax=Ruegeria sp. SCP10 TaxID=3141377 RepID=UPI00333784C9